MFIGSDGYLYQNQRNSGWYSIFGVSTFYTIV